MLDTTRHFEISYWQEYRIGFPGGTKVSNVFENKDEIKKTYPEAEVVDDDDNHLLLRVNHHCNYFYFLHRRDVLGIYFPEGCKVPELNILAADWDEPTS